jgi:hypothetical protein
LVASFLLLSFGSAVFAADTFDAPGPGYRNQVESLRTSPDPARLQQLLRDHPTYLAPEERAQRQERLLQSVEQFRGIRIYTNPLSLSVEIQKLSPTLPVLSTANPFAGPIRLLDVK